MFFTRLQCRGLGFLYNHSVAAVVVALIKLEHCWKMNKTEKSGKEKKPENDRKPFKCKHGSNRDEADLANAKWPKPATKNNAAMPNHHLLRYKHSSTRSWPKLNQKHKGKLAASPYPPYILQSPRTLLTQFEAACERAINRRNARLRCQQSHNGHADGNE